MWPFGPRSSAVESRAEPAPDLKPAAWEALPPLRRTIPEPEPTFKIGDAVKEDLVSLEPMRLTSSMGHRVSEDGPAGVVHGLATVPTGPSVQRTAGELVLRPPHPPSPVRRFWTRLTGADQAETEHPDPSAVDEAALEPTDPSVGPRAEVPDGAPSNIASPTTLRRESDTTNAVEPDNSAAAAERPELNPAAPLALARMPVVDHPVQRSTLRDAPPEPEPPRPVPITAAPANRGGQQSAPPELTLPPVQRRTTAPEATTPPPERSRPHAAREEPPTPAAPAEREAVDDAVDHTARATVDHQIRDIGPDAVAGRSVVERAIPPSSDGPAVGDDEIALPLQPRSVQRKVRAEADPAAHHDAEVHDAPLGLAAAAAEVDDHLVDAPAPAPEPAHAAPVLDETAPLAHAEVPGPAGAPLQSRTLTTSTEPDAVDGGTSDPLRLPAPPVPVLAHRPLQRTVQPTTAAQLDRHRPVQSAPAASTAAGSQQLSPALGAPAVVPPPSVPERHAPGPGPTDAARPGTTPDAGTAAISAGIAQRMPDGSVVFAPPSYRPPPRPEPVRDRATRADEQVAVAVQREVAPEPADVTTTPEPELASGTEAMTATVSTAPPEPSAAAAEGGSEAGNSDETAELVKKIWPDIRWRLRNELRVERERKGQR